MKRKFIALLLVMMTVLIFFCSGSFAAERDSISVNGHASAEVAPDMATLYGNLEKRAAVAEAARESLTKDMASFRHMLLGQMIAGQDVQTVRYTLQPEYSYEKNKRRLTGYIARADYKVKIKDLEKLGVVIDKSIGCNFTVDRVECQEQGCRGCPGGRAYSGTPDTCRLQHIRQRDTYHEPQRDDGKSSQPGYGGSCTHRTGSRRHHRKRECRS